MSNENNKLSNHMARIGAGLLILKIDDAPISSLVSHSDHVAFEFDGVAYEVTPARARSPAGKVSEGGEAREMLKRISDAALELAFVRHDLESDEFDETDYPDIGGMRQREQARDDAARIWNTRVSSAATITVPAQWIIDHHKPLDIDYACFECCRDRDDSTVVDGFVCMYHRARAALSLQEQEAKQ